MSRTALPRSFGREAFGGDPENYHRARPRYPDMVWTALRENAGLTQGSSILEIGAGTGVATEMLLSANPRVLTAVEPDPRLATFMRSRCAQKQLEVVVSPFEDMALPEGGYDLAVSATAFHWLDPVPALRRIRAALRPGGSVALFWNIFGDRERADPFHEATAHLFTDGLVSPSGGGSTDTPFGLDAEARIADFERSGLEPRISRTFQWTLTLDPDEVRALYATFSNVSALPEARRNALLDGLSHIASEQFMGAVSRNMTTSMYIAGRDQPEVPKDYFAE